MLKPDVVVHTSSQGFDCVLKSCGDMRAQMNETFQVDVMTGCMRPKWIFSAAKKNA